MATNLPRPQAQLSFAHPHLPVYPPPLLSPAPSTEASSVNTSQGGPVQTQALPGLPLYARQARPSAAASQYRPAVLRPTGRPARHFPLTPPQSSSNSFDSTQGAESPRFLSRHATADGITRFASPTATSTSTSPTITNDTDWLVDQTSGKVTGAPTRDHWKPDASAPNCDADGCNKLFGLFERRHHCRRCGNVFCRVHTPFSIPLDQHARFHPDGMYSRACDLCWSEYRTWQTDRCSRANSIASYDNPDTSTTSGLSISGRGGTPAGLSVSAAELGVQKVGSKIGRAHV